MTASDYQVARVAGFTFKRLGCGLWQWTGPRGKRQGTASELQQAARDALEIDDPKT